MENMMSLEEAARRIEELEKEMRSFAYNWNITKVEKRVEEKNIMRNGWQFTMTLSCAMKQA